MVRLALIALLLLPGCRLHLSDGPVEETYSRAEIDAINARTQCRQNARTLVQIMRCDVER